MEEKNIELEIQKLKAQAYDLVAQIQYNQNELNRINKLIEIAINQIKTEDTKND